MIGRSTTRLLAASSVATLVLVVGCDDTQPPTDPGNTIPTGTTSASSQPSTPGNAGQNIGKAPRVATPLDTSRFEQSPCGLLTDDQLSEFGGETGKTDTSATEVGCGWRFGTQKDSSADAWFSPGATKSGLSDLYVLKEQGAWTDGYFEPTEVAGFPAVFAEGSDNRENGACVLSVGVRDDMYLNLATQAPPGKGRESCTAAENLAEAMIKTLGG